ncbi:MAG: hypothetical protein KGQ59_11040, partial [Bdellovibrionales bacterium]|nr:hypothetical protein [Bdellovibrionales bacterium]
LVWTLISTAAFFYWLYQLNNVVSKFLVYVATLVILGTSGLSLHTFAKIAQGKVTLNARTQLLRHHNGRAKDWIRQNLPAGTRLVTLGDQELYYLLQYQVLPIEELPDLELKLFTHCTQDQSPEGCLKVLDTALRQEGAHYFYLDRQSYMGHQGSYYSVLRSLQDKKYQWPVLFSDADSVVFKIN